MVTRKVSRPRPKLLPTRSQPHPRRLRPRKVGGAVLSPRQAQPSRLPKRPSRRFNRMRRPSAGRIKSRATLARYEAWVCKGRTVFDRELRRVVPLLTMPRRRVTITRLANLYQPVAHSCPANIGPRKASDPHHAQHGGVSIAPPSHLPDLLSCHGPGRRR